MDAPETPWNRADPAGGHAVTSLLDFLRGTGRDPQRRRIAEVWAMTNEDLEASAAAVAWLFPLDAADAADPSHPVLDAEDWVALRRDREIRANLRRSLDRMLGFYGFAWDSDRRVIQIGPNFRAQALVWLSRGDPRLGWLTRILRSLALAGEREAALALLACLGTLHLGPHRHAIDAATLAAWRAAATGPGGGA